MAYKSVKLKATIGSIVADAYSDIETLAEEMREQVDNMEGTPAENLPKFEVVSEAADTLENVNTTPDVPSHIEAREIEYFYSVNKNKRQGPSRVVRLSNACEALRQIIEHLDTEGEKDDALRDFSSELQDTIDNVEGVEFPSFRG
jgi:hypothetical protein